MVDGIGIQFMKCGLPAVATKILLAHVTLYLAPCRDWNRGSQLDNEEFIECHSRL